MSLPTLTAEQRHSALAAAHRTRQDRRVALDQVRAGETSLVDLIGQSASDRDGIGGIRLRTALLAISGVGATRADAVMHRLGIPSNRRLRGLGPRQSAALAAWHAEMVG